MLIAIGYLLTFFLVFQANAKEIKKNELRGSRQTLQEQTDLAKIEGLVWLHTVDHIARIEDQSLEYFRSSDSWKIDEKLPHLWRWALPRVTLFARKLSDKYFYNFKTPLLITSACRSIERQIEISRNGNHHAASPEKSVHPTCSAIDFGSRDMTNIQRNWMREEMKIQKKEGCIYPIEEGGQQNTFHVFVMKCFEKTAETKERSDL